MLFIQQTFKQVWPESIQLWSSDGCLQALLEHLSDWHNQCGRESCTTGSAGGTTADPVHPQQQESHSKNSNIYREAVCN